jgi:hypothetical protein
MKKIKPKNKTLVYCTENDRKVKGVILEKTDQRLVVNLPSGYLMTLEKPTKQNLYVFRVGLLEFVSDGWAQT